MEQPFQIDIKENRKMNCHELRLVIGGLTPEQAQKVAEGLADWLNRVSGRANALN